MAKTYTVVSARNPNVATDKDVRVIVSVAREHAQSTGKPVTIIYYDDDTGESGDWRTVNPHKPGTAARDYVPFAGAPGPADDPVGFTEPDEQRIMLMGVGYGW